MNYLGAKPTRYPLRIHNFLVNIEFILKCPPSKGAMGDDLLCLTTTNGHFRTQRVIPQLSLFASPFKGGILSFPTQKVGKFNHFRFNPFTTPCS